MTLRRPKVLIVDANRANLAGLTALLGQADCDVVEAPTGNEALARCVTNDCAAILLAVDLPGMDGYEVAELLRGETSTKHIPIILLAGSRLDACQRRRGHAVGVVDTIERPFDDDALLSKVRFFLEHDGNRRTLQLQLARSEAMRGAAKESLGRFHQALTDAPIPILLYAEDGEVVMLSRMWSERTGYSPRDDSAAQEWISGTCGGRTGAVQDRVEPSNHLSGLRRDGEFAIRTAEGSHLVWDFSSGALAPLPDGRRLTISMAVDVTARKRAEEAIAQAKLEAEKANIAKSRFLAAASHDLRQPLQALGLYLELLSQRLPNPDDPVLARAKQCAEIVTEQLNDLLDVSKLETGAVSLQPIDCRIGDILAKVVTSQHATAAARGLTVKAVPCDAVVRTDPLIFERLMFNLVSNAVKYTEAGGVLIGCRRRQGTLRVEVWDTGIGIPEHSLRDIFEEFYQLDNPSRDRSKGSGLGLAIVERAAKLLGLRVSLRSRVGKGTMFAVEFPSSSFDPLIGAVAGAAGLIDGAVDGGVRRLLVGSGGGGR